VSVRDVVASYYEVWTSGRGDFSAVPLAPGFTFTGPVASFDSPEGFRAMASQGGPAGDPFRGSVAVRGW
jgi:hypothetical protein